MARLHAFVYAVIDDEGELDTEPTTETLDVEHEDPEEAGRALVVWLRELADGLDQGLTVT